MPAALAYALCAAFAHEDAIARPGDLEDRARSTFMSIKAPYFFQFPYVCYLLLGYRIQNPEIRTQECSVNC